MKKYCNPKKDNWVSICERPLYDNIQIKNIVDNIFADVKTNGDEALIKYTKKFDNIDLSASPRLALDKNAKFLKGSELIY